MSGKLKTGVPLAAEQLCVIFDPKVLGEGRSAKTAGAEGLFGQERAFEAISLSAKIPYNDFNLFVLGRPGYGRHTAVRDLLAKEAANRTVASDWVYVNNFDAPHKPAAIELPAGMAIPLRNAMQAVVDDLANDVPAYFEADDYQRKRRAIEQDYGEKHEQSFSDLMDGAKEKGLVVLRTPMGFMVAATQDGKPLTPDQYEALSEEEQKDIDEKISVTQKELENVLKEIPKREKDHRRALEELNAGVAARAVADTMAEMTSGFTEIEALQPYFEAVTADLIENAELFLTDGTAAHAGAFPVETTKYYQRPQFQRYCVNVMICNPSDKDAGAPIETEDLPTLGNLVGRVEHKSEMGALVTDFTMIKPGALHRANGGYLILDIRHVLTEPFAWDALKRCLKTGQISITSVEQRLSLFATTSLEPDPIPLNLRVALVGERLFYYLLMEYDPDFTDLFKVQADFNDDVFIDGDTPKQLARMLSGITGREDLRPLQTDALLALLTEATRLAEDAEKLSLNVGKLSDIVREADFRAGTAGHKEIIAEDIGSAIAAIEDRASRPRELTQEAIARNMLLIDTDGTETGQINALSVLQIGDFMFGRPSRITARVRMGKGRVVDIEREVELGGPLHSKGMLILSGYLSAHYALNVPMSLWASLVFEQSYGGVDGDSASAAELFALLSALSERPIDQSFAVTGSVNQRGEIQPIGGVNHKIEGFFDVCAARGLTGRQAVLIPDTNVKNLALRQRVVQAVKDKKFNIIPISTIDEGIGILTGAEAGVRGPDGVFPESSINGKVEARLQLFAKQLKAFGSRKSNDGNAPQGGRKKK